MNVEQFKAQCLRVIDEVCSSGEPVMITKKGKSFVKLVPTDIRNKILDSRSPRNRGHARH